MRGPMQYSHNTGNKKINKAPTAKNLTIDVGQNVGNVQVSYSEGMDIRENG